MKLGRIARRQMVRRGRRCGTRAAWKLTKSGTRHKSAAGRTGRQRDTAAILITVAAVGVFGSGLVHFDAFPKLHTYGVDAGTSTRYCSADLVGWRPEVSCESAN